MLAINFCISFVDSLSKLLSKIKARFCKPKNSNSDSTLPKEKKKKEIHKIFKLLYSLMTLVVLKESREALINFTAQ